MKLICNKCGCELKKGSAEFTYLTYGFTENLLKCPSCGQVFIDEDLVTGRMLEVEEELEEK